MIDQEVLDSTKDELFHKRMARHGDGYHYDSDARDAVGECYRMFGRIIYDWDIDIHVATERATSFQWGSREEHPDIIYNAELAEDTPDLNRVVDFFKFSRVISARVQTQKPGCTVTKHLDDFIDDTKPGEKIIRIMVMLQAWESGQTMSFGNSVVSYWEKGDVLYSDFEKFPHSTGNASWKDRSVLVITGAVSEETTRMLAFNFGTVKFDN
jgi:hypothetical protein